MTYTVKLASYEGPLDLLLDLLAREELDVAEVAVAQVAEQYLRYLESLSQEDLELYSEFLVIGSTMLALKARLLLPRKKPATVEDGPEESDLPVQSLVERLAVYKRFKEAAAALEQLENRRAGYWDRDRETELFRGLTDSIDPLEGVTRQALEKAFRAAVRRTGELKEVQEICLPMPEISLPELFVRIRERVLLAGRLTLLQLLPVDGNNWRMMVLNLLALLILCERGEVGLEQEELWGPIYVTSRLSSPERRMGLVE